MKAILRLALPGVVGATFFTLMVTVVVPYLRGPSFLSRETASLCARLWHEFQRSEAISVRDQIVKRCITERRAITLDLIHERLSLDEAIARFRQLNGLLDDGQDAILGTYRVDDTDDSAIRAHVLRWVNMVLWEDHETRDAVLRRLSQEVVRYQGGAAPTAY